MPQALNEEFLRQMNESIEETKESQKETKASIATMTEVQIQQGSELSEVKSMIASIATMTEVQEGQQEREMKSVMETLARLEEKIDGMQCLDESSSNQPMQPASSTVQSHSNDLIDSEAQEVDIITDAAQDRIVFSGLRMDKVGRTDTVVGDLTFDEAPINVNGGLNPQSGVFVAPRSAYYVFTLSAKSHTSAAKVSLDVLKNGILLFRIRDYNDLDPMNNIGYNFMERMDTGDTIKVSVTENHQGIYSDENDFIHFTGYSIVRKFPCFSKVA